MSGIVGVIPDLTASVPAEPDELALVEAARGGDSRAFSRLYARYARAVHGILLARIPRADVEDLVQDAFVAALQQIGSLRDASAFGGWLAAIARNRATDYLRHRPKTTELSADLAGGTPSDAGAAFVMDQIRMLPDAYRETLTLRLVEGMTGPEIAARTGLTEGSVRVNLHRGMKKLRERLEGSRS
jgi:RNA polymerase sigma-70 factor (ECF subfamily)